MNAPIQRAEGQALALQPYEPGPLTNTAALILHGDALDRLERFAGMMAKGAVTIPRHLQGNVGDCMAIAIQATQWGMNPFAVAQKTHLSQSGALGYEAQLVSAVITSSGAVDGDPEYEFLGDWNRILGKVEERKSDKGGKYYVATYTKSDEDGLGVICRLKLRGERAPRELKVMMSQCYPRFSTQWATDPMQQICYVAIRKWARRFKPGVILGVYTDDEIESAEPKFMGPADVVQPGAGAAAAAQSTDYPEADFKKNLPSWQQVIAKGRKTPDQIIAMAETKHPLTAEQKAEIRKSPGPKADDAQDVQPKVTYAVLAERINAAADRDVAAVILDEGRALPADQQSDLQKLFDEQFPQS